MYFSSNSSVVDFVHRRQPKPNGEKVKHFGIDTGLVEDGGSSTTSCTFRFFAGVIGGMTKVFYVVMYSKGKEPKGCFNSTETHGGSL